MSERDLVVRSHLSSAIDDAPIDVDERLSELRSGGGRRTPQHRVASILVALAVALVGIVFAGRAFLGPSGLVGSGGIAQPILFERVDVVPDRFVPFRTRIWSVREDGTLATPLPQPGGNNTKAVWSPDGARIAFVGQDLEDLRTSTLWVMNADGSALTALTEDFGVDTPSWSPDGQQIAFSGQQHPDPTGESSGPQGIWVVSASGGDPRLILEGDTWQDPSWAPDGTRLVVVGWDGEIANLYTISSSGSQPVRITDDGGSYTNPDWSPDGTKIVCDRSGTSGWNVDVYVMDADGSERQPLTNWRGWDSGPIWSPDGSEIVFTSDRGATPKEMENKGQGGVQGLAIYVMAADGSDVRLIYDDGAMQDAPTSWGA